MTTELIFIYDSHCPWSYAATSLINEIDQHLPEIKIHFWHSAIFSAIEYGQDNKIGKSQIAAVKQHSQVLFSNAYQNIVDDNKDSTLAANLLAWTSHKAANKTLPLLNAIQKAHFQQGNELTSAEQVQSIVESLKLSPPAKTSTANKLTKDAEFDLHEIFEMQELINTKAIPALLLVHGDNLTLLSHDFYLVKPHSIVEAIQLELNK